MLLTVLMNMNSNNARIIGISSVPNALPSKDAVSVIHIQYGRTMTSPEVGVTFKVVSCPDLPTCCMNDTVASFSTLKTYPVVIAAHAGYSRCKVLRRKTKW